MKSGRERKANRKVRAAKIAEAGPQPEVLPIVHPPAEVRYSGRGSDIRLICRAINQGWDIPDASKPRLISILEGASRRTDLSVKEACAITDAFLKIEKLRLEAARIAMAAELHGLQTPDETITVESQESAQDKLLRMLAACQSADEVDVVMRLAGA